MKKILYSIMAIVVAAAPVFGAGKTLVLEGSTTVLPIAQAAAEAFMNKYDGDLSVRGGGSGVGITSLIEKKCDIADSSRAIKDAEMKNAATKGVNPKATIIAKDGIAVIVSPSNTLNALSKQQVVDIFTGVIDNWSKLGGPNEKIVIVSRDSASGTFEAFDVLALGGKKIRADALMQASNQAVANIIAQTPGAIGYVGLGYVNSSVKALTIDGIEVSKDTVLSGDYPYSRPLYMYTNGPAKGLAKEFISFVLSPEGQKIVDAQGFVALQ